MEKEQLIDFSSGSANHFDILNVWSAIFQAIYFLSYISTSFLYIPLLLWYVFLSEMLKNWERSNGCQMISLDITGCQIYGSDYVGNIVMNFVILMNFEKVLQNSDLN